MHMNVAKLCPFACRRVEKPLTSARCVLERRSGILTRITFCRILYHTISGLIERRVPAVRFLPCKDAYDQSDSTTGNRIRSQSMWILCAMRIRIFVEKCVKVDPVWNKRQPRRCVCVRISVAEHGMDTLAFSNRIKSQS